MSEVCPVSQKCINICMKHMTFKEIICLIGATLTGGSVVMLGIMGVLWLYEIHFMSFDDIVTYVPIAFTQESFKSTDPIEFYAFANSARTLQLSISDQFVCLDDDKRWVRTSYFPEKVVTVEALDKVLHPANMIRIQQDLGELTPEDIASYTVNLASARDWPAISYRLDFGDITYDTKCKVLVSLGATTPIFEYVKTKSLVSHTVDIEMVDVVSSSR